nr:hypothetical protein BaRGS_019648 [Batillaria attramentaria]
MEKLRKSPKPAPRKVSPSAGQVEREPEFSPKQFHGQKPDPSRKDGLLTTPMIVPAIEITRDSSTERGTSFEEEIEPTGARKPTPPHDASGKPKHRQKSMEDSVEKPLPTQDPITQRYRSARLTPAEYEESNDRDSISGEINSVVDDSMVRLFIALFDYDPVTMSPIVDAVDEELPFREGQILKVYGDKDADGFYRGEANGQLGYIPCNMVSEIHIDDPDLVEQLLKESQSNSTHHPNLPGPGRRMVALYDYDPQELSPNVDAEVDLAFKQGDIVYVMGDMDEDGFFTGELHGISRKDRLSLSPPTERAIVLDTAPSSQTPPASTATPPTDDDKRGKKKGGLLNKGRNILKKFSR